MKPKLFLSAIAAFVLAVSGAVFAGPGNKDKDKGTVVIEHANSSGENTGTVEIEVGVPGAINHLARHDRDCVLADPDELFPEDRCSGEEPLPDPQ